MARRGHITTHIAGHITAHITGHVTAHVAGHIAGHVTAHIAGHITGHDVRKRCIGRAMARTHVRSIRRSVAPNSGVVSRYGGIRS